MSQEPVVRLREELIAAAERRIAGRAEFQHRPAGRPRVRRSLLALAIALGALVLAAVALAAGLISIGKPYRPPSYIHYNTVPSQGLGIPIPGSVEVLQLSTPDLHGGPPWGMRYLKTTRGLGCLQVGRLVDGQIGVLGIDDVANDDGRFHALPTNVLLPFSCEPVDAHGLTLISVSEPTAYAYGTDVEQACAGVGTVSPGTPPCPAADLRALYYGLLGPQASSLTYTVSGKTHTIHPVGPLGAYLIVVPTPNTHTAFGIGAVPATPYGPPFTRVTFKNGLVCDITTNASGAGTIRKCPVPGFTPIKASGVSAADVAAPIKATVYHENGYWWIDASFTARAAVTNAQSRYDLEVTSPPTCKPAVVDATNTEGNIRKGQTVHLREALGTCPGRYKGLVYYEPSLQSPTTGPPAPPSLTGGGSPRGAFVVGRLSVNIR
jgi:hypothetical protein